MQITCTLLQIHKHASTSPLSFYRPDALPATRPTASNHWRHITEKTNKPVSIPGNKTRPEFAVMGQLTALTRCCWWLTACRDQVTTCFNDPLDVPVILLARPWSQPCHGHSVSYGCIGTCQLLLVPLRRTMADCLSLSLSPVNGTVEPSNGLDNLLWSMATVLRHWASYAPNHYAAIFSSNEGLKSVCILYTSEYYTRDFKVGKSFMCCNAEPIIYPEAVSLNPQLQRMEDFLHASWKHSLCVSSSGILSSTWMN